MIRLKQFYTRRAYRILPVAFIYLLAVSIFFYASFTGKELLVAFTYLSSYTKLPWLFSHLWSLSVEEQFYLIWPMIVAFSLLLPRRFAMAAIAIAPLCRFVLNKSGLYFGAMFFPPSVADSLACGCLLGLYQPKLESYRSFFTWRGFPLIWACTLSIPFLFNLPQHARNLLLWPLPGILGHSAITIFNFGVALCIQNAIVARPRILNAPIAVWIGTLSYSLYIWQMPFANPEISSWMTTFPINLVLAFLVAIASFYFIERPFLNLRDPGKQRASSPKYSPAVSRTVSQEP